MSNISRRDFMKSAGAASGMLAGCSDVVGEYTIAATAKQYTFKDCYDDFTGATSTGRYVAIFILRKRTSTTNPVSITTTVNGMTESQGPLTAAYEGFTDRVFGFATYGHIGLPTEDGYWTSCDAGVYDAGLYEVNKLTTDTYDTPSFSINYTDLASGKQISVEVQIPSPETIVDDEVYDILWYK